jgi:hypothetical protein
MRISSNQHKHAAITANAISQRARNMTPQTAGFLFANFLRDALLI